MSPLTEFLGTTRAFKLLLSILYLMMGLLDLDGAIEARVRLEDSRVEATGVVRKPLCHHCKFFEECFISCRRSSSGFRCKLGGGRSG